MGGQWPTDVVAPVKIEVTMPGDEADAPSAGIELDMPAMVRDFPPPGPDLDDPFLAVQAAFLFNPLEIKQEGLIEVRAIRDGKSYKLGGLRVRANAIAPPETKEAAS
jgi:hypothetical protein